MAEKRMFNRKIVESDSFLCLSQATQNLYFHLCLNADDDGFIDNVSSIMTMTKTSQRELEILIENGLILHVSKFVYVIAHWFMHNNLQKDRFRSTIYKTEKDTLERPGNIWQFVEDAVPYAEGLMYTEDSTDKTSKGKKKGNTNKEKDKKKYGEYQNVLLTDEEFAKLHEEYPDADARIEELSGAISQYGYKYDSHFATIRNWARRKKKEQEQKPQTFGDIADNYDEPTWDIEI